MKILIPVFQLYKPNCISIKTKVKIIDKILCSGPIIVGQDSQFHPSTVYLEFCQLNLKIKSNTLPCLQHALYGLFLFCAINPQCGRHEFEMAT